MSKPGKKPGISKHEFQRKKAECEPIVWDMYIRGYQNVAIAKEVDVPEATVGHWIREGRATVAKRNEHLAADYIQVEMQRLDYMLKLCFRDVGTLIETHWKWHKDKKTGQHIYKLVKEEIERVDVTIIDRILKIQERRAKYLNLDVAKQIEIHHKTLEELVLLSYKPPEALPVPTLIRGSDVIPVEATVKEEIYVLEEDAPQ